MFTGIITAQSKVVSPKKVGGNLRVTLRRPRGWRIRRGDSIAVNGVCSTVTALTPRIFSVEYMEETLKRTTARGWQTGTMVNLESSLQANSVLGGHLVMGHVDCVGVVRAIAAHGRSRVLTVGIPKKYLQLIADKGSITIDGVSLTVVKTGSSWFSVSLVDFTLRHTGLGAVRVGNGVNIECDIIAKYVAKLIR